MDLEFFGACVLKDDDGYVWEIILDEMKQAKSINNWAKEGAKRTPKIRSKTLT